MGLIKGKVYHRNLILISLYRDAVIRLVTIGLFSKTLPDAFFATLKPDVNLFFFQQDRVGLVYSRTALPVTYF